MKSIFTTVICLTMVNVAGASDVVIWQRELSCDSNLEYRPGAMVIDSISNEVVILGTSERDMETRKSDLWLWGIDPNGSVMHEKSLGLLSEYNSFMVRIFGIKAMVKPDTGDIVRLNMFADDDVNSISLSVTNRNMQASVVKLNTPARKLPGTLILHDMISYQNDNLLLVGQDGENGIVMRTDLAGNIVWEKTFDLGQVDILSGVACDLNGTDCYVVGLSASTSSKMSFANAATVCLLHYDANGELKASNFFEGGIAPWPSSLPKVVCLPSGIVLVVYDKSMNAKATELYARAYTRELTPLWEKQILQTKEEDGPPVHFDICAISEDRFALVGQVNYWDLRFYEYNAEGVILQTLQLDREIGAGGIYVGYLDGKIIAAYTSRLKENEKEAKIKLLALKPYNTN